ncbi:hypothetical protein ACYCFC_05495 [Stutzerimonas sp. NM35]
MNAKQIREFLDAQDKLSEYVERMARLHEATKTGEGDRVYADCDRFGVERGIIVDGLQRSLRRNSGVLAIIAGDLLRLEREQEPDNERG